MPAALLTTDANSWIFQRRETQKRAFVRRHRRELFHGDAAGVLSAYVGRFPEAYHFEDDLILNMYAAACLDGNPSALRAKSPNLPMITGAAADALARAGDRRLLLAWFADDDDPLGDIYVVLRAVWESRDPIGVLEFARDRWPALFETAVSENLGMLIRPGMEGPLRWIHERWPDAFLLGEQGQVNTILVETLRDGDLPLVRWLGSIGFRANADVWLCDGDDGSIIYYCSPAALDIVHEWAPLRPGRELAELTEYAYDGGNATFLEWLRIRGFGLRYRHHFHRRALSRYCPTALLQWFWRHRPGLVRRRAHRIWQGAIEANDLRRILWLRRIGLPMPSERAVWEIACREARHVGRSGTRAVPKMLGLC